MDESIIRSVALFFYLNLFDAKQAHSASQRTLASFKDLGSRTNGDLIALAMKVLRHARTLKFFSAGSLSGEFTLPKDLKLDAWTEFKKRSDNAEYETVLWSQVLGFSDSDIAAGLGVTEGTIRHRLSRGMRMLGRFV